MGEHSHSPRRAVAASFFALVALATAILGVRGTFGAPSPEPGAEQLSQQLGQALGRLAGLEDLGPLADALPVSDVLPGDALGLAKAFDDDAPDAVGAAEDGGTECHDGADDDGDGVADDGCGDDPSVESLSDRFLNEDGTGKLVEFDDIADALQLDTDIAGLAVEIAEPNVGDDSNTDGIDFVTDATTGDIDFAITLQVAGTLTAPVALPTELIDLVAVGGEGVFEVPVQLLSTPLHLHFEKALAYDEESDGPAPTVAESVWIQTAPDAAITGGTATPALSLSIGDGADDEMTDIDDELNLGFAGVDVQGLVALELLFNLSLIDPDSLNGGASDFKIGAGEIVNTDLTELFSISGTDPSGNAVNASFEISSDLVGETDDVDLTITAVAPTLADLDALDVDLVPGAGANLELLENLRSFTATDALGAVDRLVGMLGNIQSTGYFDLDIPYVDGGTCNNGKDDDGDGAVDDGCLGSTEPAIDAAETGAGGSLSDVVSLASELGAAVMDTTDGLILPPDPETLEAGQPSFANAQELQAKLISGLDAALEGGELDLELDDTDPAHPKLLYTMTLQDTETKAMQLRLGNLSVVNDFVLTAGGNATMQAGYAIPLQFALDLTPEPVEDGGIIGSCTDGEDNGGGDEIDAFDDDCEDSRTLEQRVSIFVGDGVDDRPEVLATAGLQATGIAATARVGFLSVGLTDGTLVFGPESGAEECDDAGDLDDAACLASIDLDLVDTVDGWLTIEEVYDALGSVESSEYQEGWRRTVDHSAGLFANLPIGATLEGTTVPGGAIEVTGSSDGLLFDSEVTDPELAPFDVDALVESLSVDASALETSDLFSFSDCGNGKDDDADGSIDDGCGGTAPDAVDAPETQSAALFDVLLDIVKKVASELDASSLPPEFQQDLPFIGKSYADVVDMAAALADLAEKAALGAESLLGANACQGSGDEDGDGFPNDGCPTVGAYAEQGQQCVGTSNDDGAQEDADGDPEFDSNDGCPAVTPSLQDFDSLVDELLSSALASGLGLGTVLDGDVIDVVTGYDAATQDLSFQIDITDFTVDRMFPFVASLGDDLPALASLSTAGAVGVTVAGSGNIDFGIDLDDLAPYVLGSTDLALQIDAELADPTTFEANVGPIEVNVGKTEPGAESGGSCDDGNTADEDHDGFVNDGCDPVDAGESGAACSYGDVVNDDGDALANDGCPARTDSVHAFLGGRLHIVETHDDDEKVALADVDLGGGLDGDDVVGGVPQEECLDLNITTSPAATAGTPKHACAILPLYLGDTPIGAADTTEHHVLLAVADLSSPGTVSFQYDGADDLDQALQDAVLDLLLLESGILPLIEKLTALINDALLSVDLPVIGDALGEVVKIVEGLNTLATQIGTLLEDGDPVAALGATASSEAVTSTLQTMANDFGQLLIDAGILLEPAGGDRVPADDPSDLQVKAICGDAGICDFGGEDETNPALDREGGDDNDDTTDNCDANESADEDVDGYPNDGCDAQPNPETGPACDNGLDDDGDDVINDGCPPVDEVDEPETACDGVNDDGDSTVDDGCTWDPTDPEGNGSDANGGEGGIDNACDEGTTADEDGDGFINDGCPEHIDTAADITDIAFLFRIGQAAAAETGDLDGGIGFDPGIPGLGLGLEVENANLQATAGWDLDIGIGVSKDHGFYFVTDEAGLFGEDADGIGDELTANATILVSDPEGDPATLTGKLAFLEAKATDGSKIAPADAENNPPAGVPDNRSFFDVGIGVDLEDPGPADDKRLALSEIVAGPSFADLIDFSFNGRAELHLGLEVGVNEDIGEGLPRLTTGIHLTWGWAITGGDDPGELEPEGDELNIWMDGLYLDAGSFISEFLAPVFGDVQKFTKPFEPIIDVLNEPIPVLSDFAGEPVTMRTLGEALAAAYDIDLTLLDMVIDLIDFVNSIKTFDGGVGNEALLIPLTDEPAQRIDLAAGTLRQGKLAASQALSAYENLGAFASKEEVEADLEGKVGTEGSASTNESSGGSLTVTNLESVGISFPFLENPSSLAGLLFGQHVTLVQWEPPPLVLKFCYSQKFGPIWAVPPVFIEFGGCITLTGEFGIGYNTKGFERALFDPDGDVSGLLQGLFLIDRHPLAGGSDTNELNFRGEIFVNAQVSVLIFSAGAQGSLYLEIGIDLEDPNNDGITEYGEAANIVRTTGSVLCLFNLNGKLGIEISVFAEVDLFFWSQRWTKVLADIVLYEFKIKCDPLEEPDLARIESGVLYLNMGDDAKYRDDDDEGPDNSVGFDVTDEKWTVTRTASGVKVRALGFSQPYDGTFSKVVVTDAAGGEDAVAFLDGQTGGEEGTECDNSTDDDGDDVVNDGCDAVAKTPADPPVPENAPSVGGSAADCEGTADDDDDGTVNDGCPIVGDITLIPFDIPIDVSMGDDPDTVNGGMNGGEINGDGGTDVLIARGNAKYTITGGSEADGITGGNADDDIDGGAGDDSIDAGAGADKVVGGAGNDTIDGGRTVKSDPKVGPVVTFFDKKDTIWGDAEGVHDGTGDDGGADTIDGGEGGDELNGGGGGDRISGSDGADTINGGVEANDGCGSAVDDTIVAGPGSDTVNAMGGDDIVVGGNTIAGQPDEGDDLLAGGGGCDVIVGDNAVFDSDSDPRGFALIDPSIGGGDEITGGTNGDIIRGQVGNDTISGDVDAGSHLGDGSDQIWGDAGSDVIQGGGARDTIYGDGGPTHPQLQPHGGDVIAGGGGGDVIRGEGGADTIFGDHGAVTDGELEFTSASSGGDDDILGGPDADRIYGQEGGDTVNGDGANDEIHGDTDTDPSGGDGQDTLRGGTGDDDVFGNDDADTIYGDAGDDDLAGGSQTEGNDDSGLKGTFQDVMFGGSGTDQMTGDNADLAAYAVLLDESTIGQGDLMFGQLDDDTMFGENDDDLMLGGPGDDHMEGGADSDTIYGEADQDDIIGGTTETADGAAVGTFGQQPDDGDLLYGQGDADVIVGDNGRIVRTGELLPGDVAERAVTLWDLDSKDAALSGDDVIEGGVSADDAYGGSDADEVYGFTEASAGTGEDLGDHLEGNDGGDTIEGDAGQDDVIGGTSAHVDEGTDPDVVFTPDGGAHPDDGTDLLYGGDGSTALAADHDVLLGDNGTVERVLETPTAYQFDDLDPDAPAPRADTVDVLRRRIVLHDVATSSFDPVSPVGTPFDGDELRGEAGWDEGYGQGGDDLLRGGAQDDHLEGNAGSDDLYGEAGQDDLIGGTGRTVNDDASTAADGRLDAADELYGGDGAGGVTEDDFDVEMGDNATVLRGEPGDAWSYNTFNASVRRNVFQYDVGVVGDPADAGTSGGDTMRGEADDDLMYGQGGDDDMGGGAGDDHMQGNDGSDDIRGETGNDDMVGGTGRINDDPVQGTPGRLDVAEEMSGGPGFDWMAGDNAIIERVLVDGDWVADPNGGIRRHVLRMPDLFDASAPFGGSKDEDQVSGADTMHGDDDHDVMYGEGNRALADGTIGDVMTGGTGEDQLQGNEGGDLISGNAGEDDLIGGTGKVLGQDSFTAEEYAELDDDPTDPDLDLSDEVDAQLDLGVRDRHDGDDQMHGEAGVGDGDAEGSDSDVMLGDNAIVLRKVDGSGVWLTRTENDSRDRYVWFPDVESLELPTVLTHVHGDDGMWGNDNDDEMWGQGGDDLMFGGAGDDRMQGNHASDEMHGGPQQDDMLGGTGRVNDDPVEGTPGRLDADDLMFGDDDHDVMTGDNAIVDRPIVPEDGVDQWVTMTYKSYPDSTHRSIHVAGKKASDNTAPVAPGDFRPRTDRTLTMLDLSPANGGSPLTAGSDLMSGGRGDDDMVGQFDDSLDQGAPFTRTKVELTALCDSPDESTLFGTADDVTTHGDVVCGNSGEDAILGDQGTIVNRPEKEGRQKLLVPNTPFSRDWIFIDDTLSRLVTLDQMLEGGHDVILGGDQHDAIHSGAGGDLTNGDDGDDFIFDDDGGEIDKGTRQDATWGGRGHDTTFGGWGDDFIDVQPRANISNFPDDPADWFFFAPPTDANGFFRGFASIDHHYGGWDQDAFQADLGDNGPVHGDRLMDWVGAYNVYYLCPSTYGAWVSLRDQPPDALAHMEDLALGMGAVDVKTPGTSGFREAGIVYKPDIKSNQEPPHPDTPGHFVCSGIDLADPTAT